MSFDLQLAGKRALVAGGSQTGGSSPATATVAHRSTRR